MRAAFIALVFSAALASYAESAQAQTWSSARSGPALWQISSLDRTGEPGWPYGAEDVARDGAAFEADEAGADVRSVYADADVERLWLRAYVAAPSAPAASLISFFFIDTDGRGDTGGAADGEVLEPSLSNDPSRGGYERAIGVRGDGQALGAWEWNAQQRAWLPLPSPPAALRAEAGRARDPLALGTVERGYVQVSVAHPITGLDASCGGTIFVRTRNVAAAPRAFGDDDRAVTCRVPSDVYGDPIIVRSFSCRVDAECPISGRCREGVCLFAYDCATGVDCPTGSRCSDNRCVRAVDQTCTTQTDCRGLLCESGACVACTEGGPRTCAAGLSCSPNGTCVDPGEFEPGAADTGPGKVQGGAFSCSATSSAPTGWSMVWTALTLLLLCRGRWRPRPDPPRTTSGDKRGAP